MLSRREFTSRRSPSPDKKAKACRGPSRPPGLRVKLGGSMGSQCEPPETALHWPCASPDEEDSFPREPARGGLYHCRGRVGRSHLGSCPAIGPQRPRSLWSRLVPSSPPPLCAPGLWVSGSPSRVPSWKGSGCLGVAVARCLRVNECVGHGRNHPARIEEDSVSRRCFTGHP